MPELLPTELPPWYTVNTDNPDDEKGWVPLTSDIPKIKDDWDGTVQPAPRLTATNRKVPKRPLPTQISVSNLQVISPIQVGSGSFPEGGILPAQIGGVPCVPGSSIRGAFLHWLRQNRSNFTSDEQKFWQSLVTKDWKSWQPLKVRFETLPLQNLKPYPLNPQQEWQIFADKKSRDKLGIQWQEASPKPQNIQNFALARGSIAPTRYRVRVIVRDPLSQTQEKWFCEALETMLREQGVGRGTASGFGRFAREIPKGMWKLKLRGMKPTVVTHKVQKNKVEQVGQYRWSPQVLRACLRGYFTRLALLNFSKEDAITLTDKVFGGTSCPGELTLTSYLKAVDPIADESQLSQETFYRNIPKSITNEVWEVRVDCDSLFNHRQLIGRLLILASRLGGLGPGWRRPPHSFRRGSVFRGSQFTTGRIDKSLPNFSKDSWTELIDNLLDQISDIAKRYGISKSGSRSPQVGSLVSIWKSKDAQEWKKIVHKVCSTNASSRPDLCGNSKTRPSGYSVRQYSKSCFLTVFEPNGVTYFEHDLYLLALAKLLNKPSSRLFIFHFHTVIQQRQRTLSMSAYSFTKVWSAIP